MENAPSSCIIQRKVRVKDLGQSSRNRKTWVARNSCLGSRVWNTTFCSGEYFSIFAYFRSMQHRRSIFNRYSIFNFFFSILINKQWSFVLRPQRCQDKDQEDPFYPLPLINGNDWPRFKTFYQIARRNVVTSLPWSNFIVT